jgi:hypothetical protein
MIVTHGALRYCGEDLGVLVSLDLAACSVMQQAGSSAVQCMGLLVFFGLDFLRNALACLIVLQNIP